MKHRTRTLLVVGLAVAATLGAGIIFAYVTSAGSVNSGSWKTATGVALQVPSTGTPKLAFTAQPGAGSRIPVRGIFAVSVAIQDGFGTVVTGDSTDSITLAIASNPGGGSLTCAGHGGLTVPVAAGVASFTGCSITKAGAAYTLTASSSVRPALRGPAKANPFSIVSGTTGKPGRGAPVSGSTSATSRPGQVGPSVPGAAAGGGPGDQLAITSAPVDGTATASPTIGPFTVQLRTSAGAPVTTGITVGLASSSAGSSEFSASSGGSAVTSVVIPAGSSSVSFYYGDEHAGTPAITVSAAATTSDTQPEKVSAGPAAGLSFTGVTTGDGPSTGHPDVTCTGTTGGGSSACTLSPQAPGGSSRFMTAEVTLVDQFQNPVTSPSGAPVPVTLSQSGGASLSVTPVSIPASSPTSGPFTEKLADGNAQGTVTATATVRLAQLAARLTS